MRWRLAAVLALLVWRPLPAMAAESLDYDPVGRITVYRPPAVRSVAVLISGEAGFGGMEDALARTLEAAGALVLGIDLRQYLAWLAASAGSEAYPSADLEVLSQFAQRASGLPTYETPVLVGWRAGAALAYASLAQANPSTFRGAVSVAFCPLLELSRPLGRGRGLEVARGAGDELRLAPAPRVQGRWVVVQPQDEARCSLASVRDFIRRVAHAKLVVVSPAQSDVLRAVRAAFVGIAGAAREEDRRTPAADVGDLPLVEVPAVGTPTGTLAVMISGDGGWASIDRDIGAELAARGVEVVGLNALRYFWTRRTPDGAAADLERILRHYLAVTNARRVLLVGYSRGADVLPFLASRLAPDLRARVAVVALLGPSTSVDFEFHLSDWVESSDRGTELPVRPEVEKLRGMSILCVYGTEETDSLCPGLAPDLATVLPQPGAHHFAGDYGDIVARILAAGGCG